MPVEQFAYPILFIKYAGIRLKTRDLAPSGRVSTYSFRKKLFAVFHSSLSAIPLRGLRHGGAARTRSAQSERARQVKTSMFSAALMGILARAA
jgi:hypothetical protein